MENALTAQNGNVPATTQSGELSVEQVIAQAEKIQKVMEAVMHKDEHYGVIPGTPKPTLLKPGAEKLCLVFRLDPQYSIIEKTDGDHLTILSTCVLYHINSGMRMGSGMGSCSTKESKYAYRKSGRACPSCGIEGSIRKSKPEYGGGWYCATNNGGCNDKFKAGDPAIESQDTKRVANPDIADQYNTVLKMANKRSLVAAVLNVTAASDIFTQDLEDLKGKREDIGAGDDDGARGDARQKAGDPATPEQRKALMNLVTRTLGPDAVQWIVDALKRHGFQNKEALTVEGVKRITTELIESQRGEDTQDLGPDPADTFNG